MKTFSVLLAVGLTLSAAINEGLADQPNAPSFSQSTNGQSSGHTNQDIVGLWNQLTKATDERRETDALALALKLLKAIPIQDSVQAVIINNVTMPYKLDNRPQRFAALQALQTFDALDEYQRKVKAYYKGDVNNLTYDKLMAECLLIQNPTQATPFLEQAHKLDPNDSLVIGNLAERYAAEGNDPALISLLDSIFKNNLSIFDCPQKDVVGAYERADQLSHLTQLFVNYLKRSSGNLMINGGGSQFLGPKLEQRLIELDRKDDLIAFYRGLIDADPGRVDERMRLAALLFETGDKIGLGEQCEALLFPPSQKTPRGEGQFFVGIYLRDDIIPYTTTFDIIRIAKEAGQLDRLISRAKSEYTAHNHSLGSEEMLVFILVFGHDHEAFDLLPAYLKDIVAESRKNSGGMPYIPVYAIFGELLQWPEARELLKPTLEAGFEAERNSQPWGFVERALRVSTLALKMNDKVMAQDVLRHAMIIWRILPSPPGTPSEDPNPKGRSYVIEGLGAIGRQLVNADMPAEFEKIIPLIADESKSQQGQFPDSRTETIASLGEAAFDAGYLSSATLCAQTAENELRHEWQDPKQNNMGRYYSVTITPNAVHLTCDLLLRLGLLDQFDDLQNLLSQPTAAGVDLNKEAMLSDLNRLRLMLGDHPHGLTPALWLNGVKADSLTQNVTWEVTAFTESNNSSGRGLFSVQARSLPQLDGKFSIQIAAGATEDDLRVLKTIVGAVSRGSADIVLQPDDRFIRAICQTAEAQPRFFVGPVVPISLGNNLLLQHFHIHCFSNENGDDRPVPLSTDQTAIIQSIAGGPSPNGTYESVFCPSGFSRLELIGPRQRIKPGTTFFQSGWLKGAGQWGIRYLDEMGHVISASNISYQNTANDWQFVQQAIKTSDNSGPAYSQVPVNAVALEPILSVSQCNTLDWQGLYCGIVEQKDDILNTCHTAVMQGLQGATSIVEAPIGGILAATFENGNIRCFDLSAHLELGTPARLPGPPVEVSFVNQGKDVVAADNAGNLLVRSVRDKIPGRIVHHIPWQIDFISASSDGSIVAVGNAAEAKIIVVDLASDQEISQINIDQRPLTTLIVSSDGKTLFCHFGNRTCGLWNTLTGQPLIITNPWIHEVALGHFFHIPHTLNISLGQKPCWVQVQADFCVVRDGSSLNYSMMYNQNIFQKFYAGPITAFCLSTQSNDVYTVSAQGTLEVWKLPDTLKIPPFIAPPDIQIPTATTSSPKFVVEAPDHMRGFPNTTLSQPLNITILYEYQTPVTSTESDDEGGPVTQNFKATRQPPVLNVSRDPVPDAQLDIQSDLAGVTFGTNNSQDQSTYQSSVKTKTDSEGKTTILVHLGKQPGLGHITITASYKDSLQKLDIPLESILENAPLIDPHDISSQAQGNSLLVKWEDEADNRTGFLLEREVGHDPWRAIAMLPENATSYIDNDVISSLAYSYRVSSTNSSKYGYPAKLPPPPDRLGNFLP